MLGRPDPAYAEKKSVAEQAAAVVTAGGEVWFGDETTLREFPALRAAWAKRGQQQIVVISGRNARRVVQGALKVATGELVTVVRERSRQDDCLAFVEALGQRRPHIPKLLVWDNAPPHHPKRVQAAAVAANIRLAFLPLRAPLARPRVDAVRGSVAADHRGGCSQSSLRSHPGAGRARRRLARRPLALRPPPQSWSLQRKVSMAIYLASYITGAAEVVDGGLLTPVRGSGHMPRSLNDCMFSYVRLCCPPRVIQATSVGKNAPTGRATVTTRTILSGNSRCGKTTRRGSIRANR